MASRARAVTVAQTRIRAQTLFLEVGGKTMSAKLNHLAITTDNYTTLGMFYRAYFDMNVSGDTDRERRAISVGDGYVGVTLIPRRAGRRAGIELGRCWIPCKPFDTLTTGVARLCRDRRVVSLSNACAENLQGSWAKRRCGVANPVLVDQRRSSSL